MSVLVRYRTLLILLLYYVAITTIAAFAPNQTRGDGFRAIAMILSGWAVFTYWRPFFRTITGRGEEHERHPYSIFMFLSALGINMNMSWILLWRLSGYPFIIVNNAVFDMWIAHIIAALFVSVTVPNLFGQGVPPSDKIRLGGAWLLMFLVAAYAVLVQPDLSPISDAITPFLEFSPKDWLAAWFG